MMNKETIKRILPPSILPIARWGYRLVSARDYYPQYVFSKGKAGIPREIKYEITFRCNLRCIMCPLAAAFDDPGSKLVREWKEEKELTTQEIFNLIDDAARMGVKKIGITGGEPFLRKDIIEIVQHIKKNKLKAAILSNGTLIDQRTAERIVQTGLDTLQFSIDGSEEIHNRIRNSSTAYAKSMDAARFVRQAMMQNKARKPALSFCCTISSENVGSFKRIVDAAKAVDASISFGYLFYTTKEMEKKTNQEVQIGDVKGENQDIPDYLKRFDVERLYTEVVETKRFARDIGVSVTFEPDLTKEEIRRRFEDDTYAYTNKCFYPWYALRINPYGAVYPCSMNMRMGSIREEPLSAIWNNEAYIRFRTKLKQQMLFPKCAKCCKLNDQLWTHLPKI